MNAITIEKLGARVIENGMSERREISQLYARALLVRGKIVSPDEVVSLDRDGKDSD